MGELTKGALFPQLADPVMFFPELNSGKGNTQDLAPYKQLLERGLWPWEERRARPPPAPPGEGKGGAAHFPWQGPDTTQRFPHLGLSLRSLSLSFTHTLV